jgi:anion-transporting  ArsA/GET3 family ATPase
VTDFRTVRLHIVTGKGGTGKTSVAAALALALARDGRQVLLTEVEGRQGIAQLFDCPPLPYQERKIAVGPRGGDVHALAVDPEEALLDYLELFYNLRRAGRALRRLGFIDFATTIAPGLRDVLLTGKVKEAVTRGRRGGPRYDAVVMDAPPTGRIARFLNVNSEVAGLARVGPIRSQADSVMALLRSPETAVHIVTVLEEMPVQETLDGVGELRALDLPVGGVVVNMTREPFLAPAELVAAREKRLDRQELASGLKLAGVDPEDTLVDALLAEAAAHATRVQLEEAERTRLTGLGRPIYELPLLPDALDLGGLYRLADLLCEQGMA